jgi:hypothetical protein
MDGIHSVPEPRSNLNMIDKKPKRAETPSKKIGMRPIGNRQIIEERASSKEAI